MHDARVIERWAAWEARLAKPTAPVLDELLKISTEVRELLTPSAALQREWSALGVEIGARPLQASGGHGIRAQRRQIVVRADEPRQRQRFTVAHEFAHLLLADAPAFRDREELENACDEFARHTLMPPDEVQRWLGGRQLETPVDVLALCRQFDISIGMALRWLGGARAHHVAFVAARHLGHPRRLHERAFRVVGSSAPAHLYIPRHQRLSSIGIELDERALGVPSRTTIGAEEPWVSLRTRRDSAVHGSSRFTGPASWEARVIGGRPRALVLAIDLDRLSPGRTANAIFS